MFRFSEIEPRHFVGFLQGGKLDEHIDEIFSQFWELSPFSQFELIKYVKRRGVYPSLRVLSLVFEIDEEEAKRFLKNPYREFFVPVVGEKEKLVRGIAIKNLESILTNQAHLKSSMEVIRDFLGSGFALFFEEVFSGESYMLPAVVSLYVENPPPDAVWTGRIDNKGKIYEVNNIPKKRALAKKHNLRLIEPSYLDDVKTLKSWFDADRYDVPFYITKTKENYEGELKSLYSHLTFENPEKTIELLEVLNGFPREKLVIPTGQLPPEESAWESVVKEFYARVKEIEKVLRGREVLHIALNGPAALGFALGAVFGSQKPFVFYHYQNRDYKPIKVENVRSLKERCKEYKSIDYTLEGNGKELVVVFAFAHHDPVASVKEFTKDLDSTLLIIRHKRAGNIPVEEMFDVAKETASLIQDIRDYRDFERFHFFFATPVPIAFMVGVAFGYYNPGYAYNHENNSYARVISLEKIRKIREGGYEISN